MADRILTTHAGSLPRPPDLVELIWAKMDGQDVANDSDVLVALRSHAPGDTVQVTVDRNGSTLTIPVVVLERPAGT